jgi:hypothetical protein
MRNLRQREEFTDTTLKLVSIWIDWWMVKWVSLVGRDSMTNYTHYLGVGHVPYFMRKWQNFYRYINQGWEYFNYHYGYTYCHRMQHGGGSTGTTDESGSNMKSIGVWFLRILYWLTKGVGTYLSVIDYKSKLSNTTLF